MDQSLQKRLIVGSIGFLYVLVIIIFIFTDHMDPYNPFIRIFALLGYLSLVIAAIMTPFSVELYKIFKKSFIKIHHLFAICGLILITLHPVIFAITTLNPFAFIPVVNDWILFWELAGRPALILIYIAVIAGILRKRIANSWRVFHAMVYIALFFGLVHGILIGTSFQNISIMIIYISLFSLVIFALVYKRIRNYQRKKKK